MLPVGCHPAFWAAMPWEGWGSPAKREGPGTQLCPPSHGPFPGLPLCTGQRGAGGEGGEWVSSPKADVGVGLVLFGLSQVLGAPRGWWTPLGWGAQRIPPFLTPVRGISRNGGAGLIS